MIKWINRFGSFDCVMVTLYRGAVLKVLGNTGTKCANIDGFFFKTKYANGQLWELGGRWKVLDERRARLIIIRC